MSEKLNPYKILNVKKTDTKATIKKAYYKKAKKAHPDGSKQETGAEFNTINEAYRILSNDETRARYDNGEGAEEILKSKNDQVSEIEKLLATMFIEIVQSEDVEGTDIFGEMRDNLKKGIRAMETFCEAERKKIAKFKKTQNRILSKKKKDFFHLLVGTVIQQIETGIELSEKKKKEGEEALEFLEDFSYRYDQNFWED